MFEPVSRRFERSFQTDARAQLARPEGRRRKRRLSDFMIRSNEVEVTGKTREGEDVSILRGGAWQL